MHTDATLIQVLDGLRTEGYDGSFLVDDRGRVSCECGVTVEPSRVHLDGLRRLEGASDPADMAAVLAIRCVHCGRRGPVVARYGPEAGPGDEALLVGVGPHPRPGLDVAEAASAVEPDPSDPRGVDAGATDGPGGGHGWRSVGAVLRSIGPSLDAVEALDSVASPAQAAADRLLPKGPARDALTGTWLGHPVHPALTDLPIGFWTSAFVLDLLGGRRLRPAADALVGLGVLSAVPTIATGLADWSELEDRRRRSGAVHAAANLTATGLYLASFLRRRSGRRAAGIALALAGAAAATVGGLLGGHLAFGPTPDQDSDVRQDD